MYKEPMRGWTLRLEGDTAALPGGLRPRWPRNISESRWDLRLQQQQHILIQFALILYTLLSSL